MNLMYDAWDVFDSVDMEDGFEVWRLLNVDVTQRTLAERLDLEDVVLTPPRVQDISQIPQALVRWDAAHKEYVDAGGVALPPDKKVGAIMRILPKEVKERVMWDHPQFLESPEALRRWLKEKTKQLTKGSYGPQREALICSTTTLTAQLSSRKSFMRLETSLTENYWRTCASSIRAVLAVQETDGQPIRGQDHK